jgi:hypothetical protein
VKANRSSEYMTSNMTFQYELQTLTIHGVTRTPDLILKAADVMSSKCSCMGHMDEHIGSEISSTVT